MIVITHDIVWLAWNYKWRDTNKYGNSFSFARTNFRFNIFSGDVPRGVIMQSRIVLCVRGKVSALPLVVGVLLHNVQWGERKRFFRENKPKKLLKK